jgi:hypothetical protein
MMTRQDVRTYAGVFAASGLAVAKQTPLRDPPPTTLPRRLRPSSLGDLPRLFHGDDKDHPARRVARLSSAALVYSVRKDNEEQPKRILRGKERTFFEELHQKRSKASDNFRADRSCPHCRLLYGGFFVEVVALPPIVVVNHSARVNIDFDSESNISEATIKNFQIIVPEGVAKEIIRLSYPPRWAEITGSIFERSDPVGRDGVPLPGSPNEIETRWKDSAAADDAFLYERAVWPMNEELSALSENILRFQKFEETKNSLSYEYSLERCVRSNFGIAWESSGLDIDGGHYDVQAIPLESVISQSRRGKETFCLKWRDVLEWSSTFDKKDEAALFRGTKPSEKAHDTRTSRSQSAVPECARKDDPQELSEFAPTEEIADRLGKLGARLEKDWSHLAPFYLVTINASKAIHFTVPENGPIELWNLLTWTAPTVLFTFLNRAICTSPILLTDRWMKEASARATRLKK